MSSNERIQIIIDADATGAVTGARRAGTAISGIDKSAASASRGFSAKSALIGGGLTLLAFKAVQFGKSTMNASIEAEASMAKVKTMVTNAGFSWDKYSGKIDKVIQAQSRLTGFDDEELAESFGNMLRTTKDINKALELNALAADIARSKGVGLAGAQSLLARVYNGSFMGLKRLGLEITPVTTAQDALKASTDKATDAQKRAAKAADETATRQKAIAMLQKSFGGQAREYGNTTAGAIARAQVAWENLQEQLGARVAPVLRDVLEWILRNGDALGNLGRVVLAAMAGWIAYKGVLIAIAIQAKLAAIAQLGLAAAFAASPFGLVVGGVAALAAGYFLLKDRIFGGKSAQEKMNDTLAQTEDWARRAAAAINEQAAATDRLRGADISKAEAKLSLQEAALRERETRGTREHARAVLDLRRAKLTLADATRDQTKATSEAKIETVQATLTTKTYVKTALEAVETARARNRAFFASAQTAKDQRKAEQDLARALTESAKKFRGAAKEAREQAAATDTSTAAGRRARDELNRIAQLNITLASSIAAFRNLGGAASYAERMIAGAVARMREAEGAKAASAASGWFKGQKAQERPRGSRLPGPQNPWAIAEDRAGAGTRDDSLQDSKERAAGEQTAKDQGATNPDFIRLQGEKAVIERRRKENKTRQDAVKKRIGAVRKKLGALVAQRDKRRKELDGIPAGKKGNARRKRIKERIAQITAAINRLLGEEWGLIDEAADLIAEGREMDWEVGTLEGEISNTPAVEPIEPPEPGDGATDSPGSSPTSPETPEPAEPAPPPVPIPVPSGLVINAANIPQYALGTPYVPNTGLALLHKGEAVLSEREAANYREGGSGPVVVTLQVADGMSWLKDFVQVEVNGIAQRARVRGMAAG